MAQSKIVLISTGGTISTLDSGRAAVDTAVAGPEN